MWVSPGIHNIIISHYDFCRKVNLLTTPSSNQSKLFLFGNYKFNSMVNLHALNEIIIHTKHNIDHHILLIILVDTRKCNIQLLS